MIIPVGVRSARPRALVFAYACEPGRGSEPGAGWGLVRAVATFADCVVLVGPEHEASLVLWKANNPDDTVRYVIVPEREWPSRQNRGRIGWFLAYLRWLERASASAASLHAQESFDVAYHATYSAYWLPSPVTDLGIPSVWGPVGGAVTTPVRLWSLLGWRGVIDELFDAVVVRIAAVIPATRRTMRRATVRIVQNEATRERFPRPLRAATRVLNHALFVEADDRPPSPRGRGLLFAATLETRKGAQLVLRAMALAPADVFLTIVGDGPERERLERMAAQAGIASRVTFRGVASRTELQSCFSQSAGAVFTGLREEGGLALAEAMLSGAPVIVLAHGGAATIAHACTDATRVALIATTGVHRAAQALADAMTQAVRAPAAGTGSTLDQATARLTLREAFEDALVAARYPIAGLETGAQPHSHVVSTDRVTVVIPVFNGARFLREAALSVLAQTHRALALVIVDDGSTDDSLAVARTIASTDERVIVVHTDNAGRAHARNVGVAASPASVYVAFLDADDAWDSDKLERQLHDLRAYPHAVGTGSFMRYISSNGMVLGETGQAIDPEDHQRIARGELAPFPISSCLMTRRDVFETLGGFDAGLREAEDLDFIARLARSGEIRTVSRSLGSYRIHPDSAMARSRARVNVHARFVRQRLVARDAGRDLLWVDFEGTYRPTWRERRRDTIERWYRTAALWRGEGRTVRAVSFGALAALAAPIYTARRLYRQRIRAFANR